MDLLTLAAKITLDDSSYTKGIKNAESLGQQLQSRMSAMTVAVGNIAADVIRKSVSAIGGVISGAIDGYADYQQLVGGVETLFKASASRVQKYAEQSFKTTGLSANAYMETVTSFSASLLQGLGGDTEQAAEMANMAVQDMADNANKMGTDIGSIQAAYQGFAKQNYTMLDNLKLGYGGTASEMIRLINDSKILDHEIESLDGITFDQLVQAIHVVQSEMGITGTTAREAAETISGSKASMEAAWQDLLTAVSSPRIVDRLNGVTDPMDDAINNWKEQFSTYMNNYLPALEDTILNVGELTTAVTDAISNLPTDLITNLFNAGLESATDMVGGVSDIVNWLIDSITSTVNTMATDPTQVENLGYAIGDFIGSTLENIVTNLPTFLPNLVTVGATLAGNIVEGLWNGLFGDEGEVESITNKLQDELTDIEIDNVKIEGIINYLRDLHKEYGDGATKTAEWKAAQDELTKYLPEAGKVFESYADDIGGALDKLERINEETKRLAIVTGLQNALRDMETLYGEQVGRQAIAEATAEIRTRQKEAAQERQNVSAAAYAEKILQIYDDRQADKLYMGDRTDQVIANAWHTMMTGESDKISELIEALENYYEREGITEENTIWGKDQYDNILTPEQLEKERAMISAFDSEIDQARNDAIAAQQEAAATWEQIQITQVAANQAMEQQFVFTQTSISDGGEDVEAALNAVAAGIRSVKFPSMILPGTAGYMPRAVGIDYVPVNGFRTELHRGEAVLTASENAERRSGGTAEVVDAIQGLRNDIQNLKLVVGQKTFGQAVVDYGGYGVSEYIGSSESSTASGYGT